MQTYSEKQVQASITLLRGFIDILELEDNWDSYGAKKIQRDEICSAMYTCARLLEEGKIPKIAPGRDSIIEVSISEVQIESIEDNEAEKAVLKAMSKQGW